MRPLHALTTLSLLLVSGCYPAKDCELACNHVMDCQAMGYDDVDLRNATRESCLDACGRNDTLNFCFDDCSPAELEVRWRCATGHTGCSALDYTCDVY